MPNENMQNEKYVDPWKIAAKHAESIRASMISKNYRGDSNQGSICGMCASPCPKDLSMCPLPAENKLEYEQVEENRELDKQNPQYSDTAFAGYKHSYCPHKIRGC